MRNISIIFYLLTLIIIGPSWLYASVAARTMRYLLKRMAKIILCLMAIEPARQQKCHQMRQAPHPARHQAKISNIYYKFTPIAGRYHSSYSLRTSCRLRPLMSIRPRIFIAIRRRRRSMSMSMPSLRCLRERCCRYRLLNDRRPPGVCCLLPL